MNDSTFSRRDLTEATATAAPEASAQTAARLIAKLDRMEPAFRAEVEENERIGRLNERTLELLREAEIPRLLMSRRFGGHAMTLSDALRVVDRLVQIDSSIGWIGGNWSGLGVFFAYFPDEVVRALTAEDPTPYVGAASAMTGKAIPTEGGYRVTGRWPFGSGDLHAGYVMVPAITCDAAGTPLSGPDGAPLAATYCVSAQNLETKGNWDVLGLRATGSIDFAFTDEFVPHELVVAHLFGPPLDKEPRLAGGFAATLSYLHTSFAMGTARRLLDEISLHAAKPSARGAPTSESIAFRVEFGKQEAAVRSARALVYETWAEIDATLQAGQPIPRRLATLARTSTLHMHSVLRNVAQFALARGGGTALRAGPLQRWIRDALAGCQHLIANEDGYADVGWELLGAPPELVWAPFGLAADPGKH